MTASITLYNLSDYNEGRLNDFTIDLANCADYDEFLGEVNCGLWDTATGGNVVSSRCKDCGHTHISHVMKECNVCKSNKIETKITGEEWIIADYAGIPDKYVGTYDLDSDYFEYKKALEESDMESEAFDAGVNCGIDLDKIAAAYQGRYSSDVEFAMDCAEGMGVFDAVAVWPFSCIDWGHAASDLMYDYIAKNGHYFSTQG